MNADLERIEMLKRAVGVMAANVIRIENRMTELRNTVYALRDEFDSLLATPDLSDIPLELDQTTLNFLSGSGKLGEAGGEEHQGGLSGVGSGNHIQGFSGVAEVSGCVAGGHDASASHSSSGDKKEGLPTVAEIAASLPPALPATQRLMREAAQAQAERGQP